MLKLIRTGLTTIILVALIYSVSFAQSSFYPQGSTITPIWTYYTNPTLYIDNNFIVTNITDDTIECRITVYDQNGNIAPAFGQVYTGSDTNPWILISSATNQFELPPNSSRIFIYSKRLQGNTGAVIGRAVIEWSSDNTKTRKALMGKVIGIEMCGTNGVRSNAILLNNGQPF
ncbi:hypothetical protein [Maridesulfovibrio sp. FT414]|uniref:hypothetical protein n=1 Tax=Maridesulfovibrio sp. FT414 TaxID=2979469 RepID=UPI003D800988